MRNILLISAAALGLVACSTGSATTTSATTTLTTAETAVQSAINFYGIAKGIAEVAEVADPTLAAPIQVAISVLDPLVASAQSALTSATADAPTLISLASQIQSQAAQVETLAAPAIKAVPSAPAKT